MKFEGMWETFFPKVCIGCQGRLKSHEHLACKTCLECLSEFEAPYSLTPYYFAFPLWEMKGVPEKWVYSLIQGKQFLADVFAAFIVYRYTQFEIELPQAVTFIPTRPYVKWSQGFCAKERVAESCSKMFSIPCVSALKWKGDNLVSNPIQQTRVLVIETHNDQDLIWGGVELEKRELMATIIATSSDERSKTCPSPKRT